MITTFDLWSCFWLLLEFSPTINNGGDGDKDSGGVLGVSVVIPTYNERENMMKLIPVLERIFLREGYDGEIVVVDDNSPDGTADLLENLNEKYDNIRVILRDKPLGVGSATVRGMREAKKPIIVTMDADFAHPPSLIPKLLENIDYYDIVVASRHIKGGGMIAPPLHAFASYTINLAANLLLRNKVRDNTGGFKAIKKTVIDKIEVYSRGGEYDIELLYKAERMGFCIKEVPFVYTWRKLGGSKNRPIYYFTYLHKILQLLRKKI